MCCYMQSVRRIPQNEIHKTLLRIRMVCEAKFDIEQTWFSHWFCCYDVTFVVFAPFSTESLFVFGASTRWCVLCLWWILFRDTHAYTISSTHGFRKKHGLIDIPIDIHKTHAYQFLFDCFFISFGWIFRRFRVCLMRFNHSFWNQIYGDILHYYYYYVQLFRSLKFQCCRWFHWYVSPLCRLLENVY